MDPNRIELKIKKELPKGLIISSFLAIFFVIALLPFVAWLLEYKDTITAPLTITTKTTPVDMFAKSSGELVLRVSNKQLVKRGAALAIIKNTANYEDILLLKTKLNQPDRDPLMVAKDICESKNLNVGEIKPALVEVINAIETYHSFLKTDKHNALVNSRQEQIKLYQERRTLLLEKSSILLEDEAYAEKFAKIDKELLAKDVIATREYDKSQREKLGKEMAGIDNKTLMNVLDIEIKNLQQERIEIRSQFKTNEMILSQKVKDALLILENEVKAWEQDYVITANIDGTCVYKDQLNDFRYVEKEEKIFSIVPDGDEQSFALLKLPMAGAGKVQKGQEVYVKLNNYPFMEFGVLKGVISDISTIPFENHYNVQVNFPQGFVSTYGDTLATSPLMIGIGEVIVEKKTLYNRIADQVKSVRYNR